MKKKTILIDLDDTIVDFTRHFLEFTGLDSIINYYEINDYFEQLDTPHRNKISKLFAIPGLYDNVKPIPGAIEAIKLLKLYHDVYIVTRINSDSLTGFHEKAEWVKTYLDIDISHFIGTYAKHLLSADVLIDDSPPNVKQWFRQRLEDKIKYIKTVQNFDIDVNSDNNPQSNPQGFIYPAPWNGFTLKERAYTGIDFPLNYHSLKHYGLKHCRLKNYNQSDQDQAMRNLQAESWEIITSKLVPKNNTTIVNSETKDRYTIGPKVQR